MTALAFREWFGGEKAINDYCHKTALEGSKKLVDILGTRDIDVSGEMTLNMVRVKLSLSLSSLSALLPQSDIDDDNH